MNLQVLLSDLGWPSKSLINYILFPVNFSSSTIFNGLLMSESDAGKPVRHIGRVTCGLHFLFYISISYIFYIILRVSISNNCASENQFVLIVLLWWWRPFRCALLHHCIYTVITCKLHLNPPGLRFGGFGLKVHGEGLILKAFRLHPVPNFFKLSPGTPVLYRAPVRVRIFPIVIYIGSFSLRRLVSNKIWNNNLEDDFEIFRSIELQLNVCRITFRSIL